MTDAIDIARENIDAFNAADWSRMEAMLAPNAIYSELATQRRVEGLSQIVEALRGSRQAFPDAKGTVTHAVGDGNNAALEISWEGTHTGLLEGPGGTIPPSGKVQVTEAAFCVTSAGDKIVEARQYFDLMTLLQQIGAGPAPGGWRGRRTPDQQMLSRALRLPEWDDPQHDSGSGAPTGCDP